MDTTSILTATVMRANGRGFVVHEREGWLNISRYADPADVVMPAAGQRVTLTLDSQGYVRRIAAEPDGPTEAHQGHQDGSSASWGGRRATSGRDATITRLAVLNTSVSILASGGRQVEPGDVLTLAAQLEGWARR